MATEVKKVTIDMEWPSAPMHGSPPSGTSFRRELVKILDAGCAANSCTYLPVRVSNVLAFEVTE